ncbi:MAG: DUF1579 domain-containing protein [Candidatus Eisenbacteria bacterium]|uniref:DUF1579 domain-containing protein n=1 Tax=Eiseniibacteriota bacterium TaxID=2212470 RepID=A0A538U977_UNCEI|nr:MAG: DUF1579 domain-containing protein [Candidatus Eisenbacteria bacterium]
MTHTEKRMLLMLAASCLALTPLAARADEAGAMPMPKAGPEVAAIAPIFGVGAAAWKGTVEAGAMGPESKLGGMWYACDVEDTYGVGKDAMTWKGHMVVGYDVNAKAYKATCVDNMGTLTNFDGMLEGTKFTLVTPTEVMMMGQMLKDRLTWDMADPKAIKFTDEHQVGGGDWKLVESSTMMATAMKPMAGKKAEATAAK